MKKIYTKLFDFLEIGDDFPTILMGVLNLSPESFYQGSVYPDLVSLEHSALTMIQNGAKILDLGARSTAPWSQKITVDEEIKRIVPAMECLCKIIPDNLVISVDTQYNEVAEKTWHIAITNNKKIMINDVSCLKTDPSLIDFVIEKDLPLIVMASKHIPGDILTIEQIIEEFRKVIDLLLEKGYDVDKLILDPGIGRWIPEKTHLYDLKIIGNLSLLRILEKPILIALSRKSFIGSTLEIPDPENRYIGSLSATAIAVFNGAHIVRTHDVNNEMTELVKMAEIIRENR